MMRHGVSYLAPSDEGTPPTNTITPKKVLHYWLIPATLHY